jgi:thiamine biosynthesis lipoprotein
MSEASLRKPLFGKDIDIAVWDMDGKLASPMLEDAYSEGLRLQKIFNFYDPGSFVSRLNRKRKAEAPAEFLIVLGKALELCEKTRGRYDISLGRQFTARKSGKPVQESGSTYRDISVEGGTVELTHGDALVDLGSIAKGYIADRIAESLRSEGALSGIIDARGDIRAFGEHENLIGIQHPRDRGKILSSMGLREGGVATSGDYSQFDGTFERPHILNGSDYISVTTLSGTLMEADAYATAIFVTPSAEVPSLLEGTGVKAMCVREGMGIEYHNGFEGCLQG